jgi:hypothetical protein
VTPSFSCSPKCELVFKTGSNDLYLFATTTTATKALYTAMFDASQPAGTSLAYTKWSVPGVDISFQDSSIGEWQVFISTDYGST